MCNKGIQHQNWKEVVHTDIGQEKVPVAPAPVTLMTSGEEKLASEFAQAGGRRLYFHHHP